MQSRSHEKWTSEEERDIVRRIKVGESPTKIAHDLGRSELGVRTRLIKLALLQVTSADGVELVSALSVQHTPLISKKINSTKLKLSKTSQIKPAKLDIQQAFHRFHFVYAIVNSQAQIYVGYSQDVWHRVGQHNKNKGAKATQNKGPWFPFSITCLAAEVDARTLENEIHRNFDSFAKRNATSLREVLVQIGVPFDAMQVALVR